MMELLAPVGGKESLQAALRSGADAVYLGFGDFNARRNAENFSPEELKEAIKACKIRGVKVYLALNILVYEAEISAALDSAEMAAKFGADGLILADLGLAKLIKEALPEMPLHASTQMTVHSSDALPLLKEMGFSRVVPSREMSREELRIFIKKAHELDIEVEVFGHGALCMSMSGGCLMSAYLGGRSGNRGLCAGTCRLPFSARGARDEYALSLKDLCLIKDIEELQKIGVDSLKIEGRMKPPEYVAAAVSAYRERLDTGAVSKEKLEILEGVFSRNGFTNGYFSGERKDMFGVRSDENIALSREIKNKTHEFFRNEFPRVKIDAEFICKAGEPAILSLTDGENEVKVSGATPEIAINRPIDEDYALSQIGKLGGSPYLLNKFKSEIQNELSMRASELNNLRREAVNLLDKKRADFKKQTIKDIKIPSFSRKKGKTPELIIRARKSAMLEEIDLDGVSAVIIPAEEVGKYEFSTRIIADIPQNMSDEAFIEKCFEKAKSASAVYVRNLAAVNIAKERGIPFIASPELNILNPQSLEVLKNFGASGAVLSYEMKLADLEKFPESEKIGAVLYGKTKLMLTRNCPIKSSVGCENCEHALRDRKSVDLPVFCRGGYAEIYNSRPIYLADRCDEFSALDFAVLEFIDESKDEINAVLKAYKGESAQKPLEYTRGLYYKGVY